MPLLAHVKIASPVGDILEIGALWSTRVKDIPSFDRYFSQLQVFYTDYR
jgi:26S proteasome regulatory subunit N12